MTRVNILHNNNNNNNTFVFVFKKKKKLTNVIKHVVEQLNML